MHRSVGEGTGHGKAERNGCRFGCELGLQEGPFLAWIITPGRKEGSKIISRSCHEKGREGFISDPPRQGTEKRYMDLRKRPRGKEPGPGVAYHIMPWLAPALTVAGFAPHFKQSRAASPSPHAVSGLLITSQWLVHNFSHALAHHPSNRLRTTNHTPKHPQTSNPPPPIPAPTKPAQHPQTHPPSITKHLQAFHLSLLCVPHTTYRTAQPTLPAPASSNLVAQPTCTHPPPHARTHQPPVKPPTHPASHARTRPAPSPPRTRYCICT